MGSYVLRTSVGEERLDSPDIVCSYKLLTRVERALRAFKGTDVAILPIRHWTEIRVRAQIPLCMLAYGVQWHLERAWARLAVPRRGAGRARRSGRPGRSAPEGAHPAGCPTAHRPTGPGLQSASSRRIGIGGAPPGVRLTSMASAVSPEAGANPPPGPSAIQPSGTE